ncbi:MAG: acyl-CoA reductase [Sphingobacteriaceae bacterium]|nr:acyl-CoA reductase [Cytophagaceae bacterium]
MDLSTRIEAFGKLGEWLSSPENRITLDNWAVEAYRENTWFTPEFVPHALEEVASQYLDRNNLSDWVEAYSLSMEAQARQVGVIMAGNIPAVGFHDALCVLMAGHNLLAKLSSQDSVLMRRLLTQLTKMEPRFKHYIEFGERLNGADAVIATGSTNSSRYFEYYFGKKPHVIRKNRSSVAVLTGRESSETLRLLGKDVLTYFGLGCRNVSKLFVPEGYEFDELFSAIEPLGDVILHHKFRNNYDYNKSVLLINQTPFLDNGFLLISENPALVSPISVLYYETYATNDALTEMLAEHPDSRQCLVSAGQLPGSQLFGTTQSPSLSDYADGVDTFRFLLQL